MIVALGLGAAGTMVLLGCGDEPASSRSESEKPRASAKRERVDHVLDEVRKNRPIRGLKQAHIQTRHSRHRFRRTPLAAKGRAAIEKLFNEQVLVVAGYDGDLEIHFELATYARPAIDRRVTEAQMSLAYRRIFESGLRFKQIKIGAFAPDHGPPHWAPLLETSISRRKLDRNPEVAKLPELHWKIESVSPYLRYPKEPQSSA